MVHSAAGSPVPLLVARLKRFFQLSLKAQMDLSGYQEGMFLLPFFASLAQQWKGWLIKQKCTQWMGKFCKLFKNKQVFNWLLWGFHFHFRILYLVNRLRPGSSLELFWHTPVGGQLIPSPWFPVNCWWSLEDNEVQFSECSTVENGPYLQWLCRTPAGF